MELIAFVCPYKYHKENTDISSKAEDRPKPNECKFSGLKIIYKMYTDDKNKWTN